MASRAEVGMGAVAVFDRDGGGIDVDWKDARQAPEGTPRIVIDGDVGLGLLEVRHTRDNPRGSDWDRSTGERNSACTTS